LGPSFLQPWGKKKETAAASDSIGTVIFNSFNVMNFLFYLYQEEVHYIPIPWIRQQIELFKIHRQQSDSRGEPCVRLKMVLLFF
jgi:hypothetical protein